MISLENNNADGVINCGEAVNTCRALFGFGVLFSSQLLYKSPYYFLFAPNRNLLQVNKVLIIIQHNNFRINV